MNEGIRDREIVVAGGTGGLGSVTTELLAAEGARLTLGYRSNSERAAKFARLGKIVAADLADAHQRSRLLDAAPSLYGLVIFSGNPARVREDTELEGAMRRSHEFNYLGPTLLAREAANHMRANATKGAIILISSMQATATFAGSTAYAAQKAALMHAGRILAKENRGPADIRVNVICPGVNDAGMAQASIASRKYDRYISEGFISRFGQAVDVARAVRFFLEPDNYITGQVLTIDGGLTL